MTARWKNILIGSFLAAALGLGASMVLFLKPRLGDGKERLQVRFINISGINKGTRVTFAGRPVGEVAKVEEIPNARAEADEQGRVYTYQLSLRFDSSISVYTTDEIAIRTTGLMGEKSIAILPKAVPPGKTPEPARGHILYANSTDPFENTLAQIGKVAAKAELTIGRFDDWFRQNAPILSHAAASIASTSDSLDTVLTSVEKHELVPSLKETLELAGSNLLHLKRSIENDALLSRISNLTSDLSKSASVFNTDGAKTLRNLGSITQDMATGNGTLGRFLKGDDFYLRMNSLMSKGETLMNDINHYGLLFQYSKGWQRLRTKKANLMTALDTPKDFKTYFEGEIDSITASLGRINGLLEKAEQEDMKDKISQSDGFKRDFATLLRQIESLNDTIKLYNQELIGKLEE